MFLRYATLRRGEERGIPEHPAHIVLSRIGCREGPVGAVPASPLVIPACIIPEDVAAGFAQQVHVAQIEREPTTPIICARCTAGPDPWRWPIDSPAGFSKVVGIGEIPKVLILPVENLIPYVVEIA